MEKLKEYAINLSATQWQPFGEPFAFGGIRWKLLRADASSGVWTAIFDCPAGSRIAAHTHYSSGEYLLTKGRMDVRGGADSGGETAIAPTYGYESNGAVHDRTNFPIDSEFFMTFHGPVAFTNPDDSVFAVIGWEQVQAVWEQQQTQPQ